MIGCGAVARLYYMPALRELEAAGLLEVIALLDPIDRHAALLREAFPQAHTVTQLSELPRHAFDLAIVASPHSLHAAQTIHLLEAGASVLCEKPMATSVDDAAAMARAAAANQGLLAIGLVRRFFPATQMIRHMLALRVLGEISSFEFSEGYASFGWPAASRGYFNKLEAQGGVLMDIGVHALDLLQWWLGKSAVVDYADDAMGGIEANCLIHCRLDCGATGELRLSRDCALANRYTVRGTRGWLSWEVGQVDHFEFGFTDSSQVIQADVRNQAASNFEQSFLSQLRNVIAALRGTEALRVPAAEGIASIELIEHCYRQRSLMAMPWLGDREIARGRELNGITTAGPMVR
jgi:predicted dehydrogenase